MRKIISFELKKFVSRIGIYILAALLAGLLVASYFMYKPEHPEFTSPALAGETVSDMYTKFQSLKIENDEIFNSISLEANSYIPDSSNYNKYNDKQTLMELLKDFDNNCLLYDTYSNKSTSLATGEELSALRRAIKKSKDALYDEIFKNVFTYKKDDASYYILTTNQNYSKLKTLLNSVSISETTFDSKTYIDEYKTPIYDCFNNFVYPNLSKIAQKYVEGGVYYNLVTSRMEEIEYKIEQEYLKVALDENLNESALIKQNINSLFAKYDNCLKMFEKAFNSSICVNALNSVTSKSDRANLYAYESIDLYEQEELEAKYTYYLENNASENDYGNSLSVTHTSNEKTTAYDFTFFVMSIFTIAIILFAIYLASHSISGEISNKSMRFIAIRPISRGSMFLGKYFAVIIMSAILLIFSTITSLCIGGIMYGFDSAKILMVMNGNNVFVAHPLLMIGLFTLSNFLMIVLYTAIAMLFSTIFKSELLAMLFSIIIYAGNIVLPLFFGVTSWLRFYPLANINLFAYFGSTQPASDSMLAKLFNNVVYQGMSMWITLIYIVGITALLLLISKIIFRKRQL